VKEKVHGNNRDMRQHLLFKACRQLDFFEVEEDQELRHLCLILKDLNLSPAVEYSSDIQIS
jgi:hypothetical protein